MELIAQVLIVAFMVVLAVVVFRSTEFKLTTQNLTMVALLIVVAILLGTRYLTIPLPILGPDSFEIKFDTIPIMFVGILFGPAWGFLAGFLTDVLQLMFSAVTFPFFGFTLNLVLTGVISGLVFSKHNRLKDKTMVLLSQGFIAVLTVVSIMYIAMIQTIVLRGVTYTPNAMTKIIIGLILFILATLVIIYLQRIVGNIKDASERSFVSRFAMVVIICEVVIQMILTSLWLSIMFKLPWVVYMAPRLLEAVIMIFLYIFVGQALYRLIFKRLMNKAKE